MKRTDLIGDGEKCLIPAADKTGRRNAIPSKKGQFQQARGGQWDNRRSTKTKK